MKNANAVNEIILITVSTSAVSPSMPALRIKPETLKMSSLFTIPVGKKTYLTAALKCRSHFLCLFPSVYIIFHMTFKSTVHLLPVLLVGHCYLCCTSLCQVRVLPVFSPRLCSASCALRCPSLCPWLSLQGGQVCSEHGSTAAVSAYVM